MPPYSVDANSSSSSRAPVIGISAPERTSASIPGMRLAMSGLCSNACSNRSPRSAHKAAWACSPRRVCFSPLAVSASWCRLIVSQTWSSPLPSRAEAAMTSGFHDAESGRIRRRAAR